MFNTCLKLEKINEETDKLWKAVTYVGTCIFGWVISRVLNDVVFDAPGHKGVYEERVKWLEESVKITDHIVLLGIEKCKGKQHLKQMLLEVEKEGGKIDYLCPY